MINTNKILFISLFFLCVSCNEIAEKAEGSFGNLDKKIHMLDSMLNTEIDKVQKLDTLMEKELKKVKQLDSLLHHKTSKIDSILTK